MTPENIERMRAGLSDRGAVGKLEDQQDLQSKVELELIEAVCDAFGSREESSIDIATRATGPYTAINKADPTRSVSASLVDDPRGYMRIKCDARLMNTEHFTVPLEDGVAARVGDQIAQHIEDQVANVKSSRGIAKVGVVFFTLRLSGYMPPPDDADENYQYRYGVMVRYNLFPIPNKERA